MFWAGIDPGDLAGLRPGALLVLAVPLWCGWLYDSRQA